MPRSVAAVLTFDLGTSATKAALWRGSELVALARAPVPTSHPAPGRSEQDPDDWWRSVERACGELFDVAPRDLALVGAIGFSAARETFALYDDALHPLTPGILWSDQRAADEVATLGDRDEFRTATGVVLDAATPAAKLAWLARHDSDALERARWILHPRDLIAARLTGVVAVDETLAARTGLCALDGEWRADALAAYGDRLPPVVPASTVLGRVDEVAARALHLPAHSRVVVGAGDRACEVLGTAASPSVPMVSWGTTVNLSVPRASPILAAGGTSLSRGALGGFVIESGLSAAGAAVAWLSSLTGRPHDELLEDAGTLPPGADGVVALPWLAGARAPWWRRDVHAAFVGLTEAHGPAHLARALVEGIAFDVARCLESVAPRCAALTLAGGGAAVPVWRRVLGGVTGLPVVRRSIDEAASVGARMVVAAALGERFDVEVANPVVGRDEPDLRLVLDYRPVRARSDAMAAAVLGAGATP